MPQFPRDFGTEQKVKIEGFPVSTFYYRAPEVAFGDPGFGRPIDMWSLGVVVMEMCGQVGHWVKQEAHPKRWGYLYSIAGRWLGAPRKEVFEEYSMAPSQGFLDIKKPPKLDVYDNLCDQGCDFVKRLLEWHPGSRLNVEAAAAHGFLNWDVARILSAEPFQGQRHPWNLLEYQLGEDVLKWLQMDSVLLPSNIQSSLGVSFSRRDGPLPRPRERNRVTQPPCSHSPSVRPTVRMYIVRPSMS